jgi:hypothetical protein
MDLASGQSTSVEMLVLCVYDDRRSDSGDPTHIGAFSANVAQLNVCVLICVLSLLIRMQAQCASHIQ